jgi:hypothetical protein
MMGDYDNDGRGDLLLSGGNSEGVFSKLYHFTAVSHSLHRQSQALQPSCVSRTGC